MSGAPPLPGDDDPDGVLAAEFVLRLLDPAEEAAAAARVASDPGFAAEVLRWQAQFATLDGEFAEVAPSPALAARVEAAVFGAPPSVLARIWASAGLWRAVAAGATAVAVAALVLPRPAPVVPPAPALIATVAPAVGAVELVAVYEPSTGTLRFTRHAGTAAPGRALELWVLPAGASVPASLGVVPAAAQFEVMVPPEHRAAIGVGTALMVSDEVAGGSPTGLPEGAVLAEGTISAL